MQDFDSSLWPALKVGMVKVFPRAMGLLVLAGLSLLPVRANGQCPQPAPLNPKVAVLAPQIAGAAVKGRALAGIPQAPARLAETQTNAPLAVISKPRLIEVPDLGNKTIDEVRREVENRLTIRNVYNNNPGWIVERQFPARFSYVALCSALDLWMAPPPPQMTTVPKIVGVREDQIGRLLESYHLKYAGATPKESNATPGTLFDQYPEPETREPWGQEVVAYRAVSPPPPTNQPPTETPSVDLNSDVKSIKPGGIVRFVATLKPHTPDAEYVFDFNDGPPTSPGGPEATHRFEADRDYSVKVTATFPDGRQVESKPDRINVHAIAYTLGVAWVPLHPAPGQPVVFTATLDPANAAFAHGSYYFFIGANAQPIQSSNTYSASFARPGSYPVKATVHGEHGHTIESDAPDLVVIEVSTPSPRGWVLGLSAGVLLVSLIGLHFLRKYVTGRVGVRPAEAAGSVDAQQAGLEAAFGFRLERSPPTGTAVFRGPVVLKVERMR